MSVLHQDPDSTPEPTPRDICRCRHAAKHHEYGVGRCRCGCPSMRTTERPSRCCWCGADTIRFVDGAAERHKVVASDTYDCPGSLLPGSVAR